MVTKRSLFRYGFFPPGTVSWATEALTRLVGWFFLVLGSLMLLALLSHSPADLDVRSDLPKGNLLGAPGASFAELSLRMLGLSAVLGTVILLCWGGCLVAKRELERFNRRLLFAMLAMVLTAMACSALTPSARWPLPTGFGGHLGVLLLSRLGSMVGLLFGNFGTQLFAGICGLVAAGMFYRCVRPEGGLTVMPNFSGWAMMVAAAIGKGGRFLVNQAKHGISRWQQRREERRKEQIDPEIAEMMRGDGPFWGREESKPPRMDGPESTAKEAAPESESDGPVETEAAEAEEITFESDTEVGSESSGDQGLSTSRHQASDAPVDQGDHPTDKAGDVPFGLALALATAPRFWSLDTQRVTVRGLNDAHAPEAEPAEPEAVEPEPEPVVEPSGEEAQDVEAESVTPEAASGDGLPPLDLLHEPELVGVDDEEIAEERLAERARHLETVLQEFGIKGEIVNARPGPVVTLFELDPAPGIRTNRVIGLADDIARSMGAVSARIAVVPGQTVIGVELANAERETVFLRPLLACEQARESRARLPLVLGCDIGGEPVIADLGRMPHLLIAGTTGSGKSVAVNAMILSLLYRYQAKDCRIILIDPKMLELSVYNDIPHLLAPVVTDPRKAVLALNWAVREMEDRYRLMSLVGVRNVESYNNRIATMRDRGEVPERRIQLGHDPETGEPVHETHAVSLDQLSFLVVVVDELADLMMVAGKEIEFAIKRLAQMARAAGIHLIVATQRPSVDVITGTIKANFPTRIGFQVSSRIDSRTIFDEHGAEQLLGQGDMLFMLGAGRIRRVHGPFVSDGEVEEVVNWLKKSGKPDYVDITADPTQPAGAGSGEVASGSSEEDALYGQAIALMREEGRVSTSLIQRRLQIGYNRAARLVERMEQDGLVSAPNNLGKREVLPVRQHVA